MIHSMLVKRFQKWDFFDFEDFGDDTDENID